MTQNSYIFNHCLICYIFQFQQGSFNTLGQEIVRLTMVRDNLTMYPLPWTQIMHYSYIGLAPVWSMHPTNSAWE